MYTEVTGQKQGDKAWLVGPAMKTATGSCTIRLWYHMKGSRIQDLNIWYRTVSGGTLYKVASQSGTSGDVWLKMLQTFSVTANKPFEVILEGKRGIQPQIHGVPTSPLVYLKCPFVPNVPFVSLTAHISTCLTPNNLF